MPGTPERIAVVEGLIEREDSRSIVCQFCGEGDFDLYGVKMHMDMNWCPVLTCITHDYRNASAVPALTAHLAILKQEAGDVA